MPQYVAWEFPEPAAKTLDSDNLNSSMIEFFRRTLTNRQPDYLATGFGSDAIFVNDTIELLLEGKEKANIEQYCLQCLAPYSEMDGWGACDDFQDEASINLITTQIGYGSKWDFAVEHVQSSQEDNRTVSAAICAFGTKEEPERITHAYPFMNKEPGSWRPPYQFNKDYPGGANINRARSSEAPTPTASLNPGFTSQKYVNPGSNRQSTISPGAVIGAILGSLAIGILVFFCTRAARKGDRPSSSATKPATITYRQSGNRYLERVSTGPTTPARPLVRDRLSAVERRSAAVQERANTRNELPPPAYEQVVVDTAREAEYQRNREERERVNAEEMARDRLSGSRNSTPPIVPEISHGNEAPPDYSNVARGGAT